MAPLLLLLVLSGVTSALASLDLLFSKKNLLDYHHKEPERVPADQRRPLNTVRVTCHPDSLEILIQADLFGAGMPVRSSEVRLGTAARENARCGATPSSDQEYKIVVGLLDCGTKYWMTDVSLVYTNLLIYTPAPSPDGLIRMDGAVVPIECHYARRYSLSSSSIMPTWIPFMATQAAVETLDFKLRIMTNDWQYERSANVYYLGEPIFLEASVRRGHHVGLRVFLSSCVATLQPNIHSVPRYVFIEDGCLLDSKLQSSKARFLARTQDDKLQLVIDAFRFHDEDRGELYITCLLNAVPVHDTEAPNKACTFVNGRWRSVDGNDYLCGYCQSQNKVGNAHSQPAKFGPRGFGKPAKPQAQLKSKLPASGWEHQAKVGPVLVLPKQKSWTIPEEELPPVLQKIKRPALYGSHWLSGLKRLKEPEKGIIPGLFTEDLHQDDLTSDENVHFVDGASEKDLKDEEYDADDDEESQVPEPAPTLPSGHDDLTAHPEVDFTAVSNLTDASDKSMKESLPMSGDLSSNWTGTLVPLTGERRMFASVGRHALAANAMPASFFCLSLLLSSCVAIRTLKEGPMIDQDGREYKSPVVVVDTDKSSESPSNPLPPVLVTCTPSSMIIQVKTDTYGPTVSPEELFLGEEYLGLGQCRAFAVSDSELVIKAGLQQCGTQLRISEDSLIYSNQLTFSPAPYHRDVTRKSQSVVPVSCRYKRTHIVSSPPRAPLQILATSRKSPSASSDFSLKLMSDDWTRLRLSNVFYLGDMLNMEASYANPAPEPRRLFIDSCVATLSPEASSVPRYFLIENNGCLADSKQPGSRARFLSRSRADVLRLQLDAFLFNRDERNTLFLTCRLKVTSDMWRSSPVNKACTYMNTRWENVDGSPDVCRCCHDTCRQYSHKHLKLDGTKVCDVISLGPLVILPKK
nr:uncharacterized protein LOC125983585 [Syngnathus scovelli]